MPIVNCYTTKKVSAELWDQLILTWAKEIAVSEKDISIHVFNTFSLAGEQYELKVELYLPSLWSEEAIRNIQNSFLISSEQILGIKHKDTFLMTQVIKSGHVIDRGRLEEWSEFN